MVGQLRSIDMGPSMGQNPTDAALQSTDIDDQDPTTTPKKQGAPRAQPSRARADDLAWATELLQEAVAAQGASLEEEEAVPLGRGGEEGGGQRGVAVEEEAWVRGG